MNFDKLIRARRSIRKYKDKTPDWRDIIECIDATRFVPMAGNIYSLKYILTSDPEKIHKLADCTQQPFITQAPYVLVIYSDPKRTIHRYGEIGQRYLRQQAGAAIQNFLLKITDKGLGTCWIGVFVESMVKKCFKIPEEMQIEAIFPIGYEFKKPTSKRPKIGLDQILYFEKHKNQHMEPIKKINT
ncbi:MAG: nitroreductase family protein [archaeon]